MECGYRLAELLPEFDPSIEHLSKFAAGLVGCGAKGGSTLALRVLGSPSYEDSIIISNLFGGRPRKCSIQPALKQKLSRGL